MYNHLLFLLYWLVNTFVIYVMGLAFPDALVLGNARLFEIEAAVYSAFWLTFFVWCMWDFIFIRGVKLEPAPLGFLYFFVVNALGVWLVSRYSQYTGLGIVHYGWALLLGLVTDSLQRFVWKYVVERNKTLSV